MHSPFVNQKWNQVVSGHLLILNHKSKRTIPGFNILWEPSKLLTFKSLSVNCYRENLGLYSAELCVGKKVFCFRMAAGGRMDTTWWTHKQGLCISLTEILCILKKRRENFLWKFCAFRSASNVPFDHHGWAFSICHKERDGNNHASAWLYTWAVGIMQTILLNTEWMH